MLSSVPPKIDLTDDLFNAEQTEFLKNTLRALTSYNFDTRESVTAFQAQMMLPPDYTGLRSAIMGNVADMIAKQRWNADQQDLVPSGAIIAFDGTIQEARGLKFYDVCDGSSVDAPDLRDMFLRGSDVAGVVGGCNTAIINNHCHTCFGETAIAGCHTHDILSSGCHTHCTGAPTGTFCLYYCLCHANLVVVPCASHVHSVPSSGLHTHTTDKEPSHSHEESIVTSSDGGATIDTVPVNYSVIYIRRK